MSPAVLAHPEWALTVAVFAVAAAVAVGVARAVSRRRIARLLPDGRAPGPGDRLRDLVLLGAVAAVGAALLGPQVGERVERVAATGLDVVLLIDVSRSMDASDVPPTRIDRARRAALDVLARLDPGDRAAVAAFAGRGVLLTPLTPDRDALTEVLASVEVGLIEPASSHLGAGVRAALEAFEDGSPRPRSVLLLSDGEDSERGRRLAAAEAARRHVRVVTAALGTDAGSRVPDGARVLRDSDGAPVVSRRRSDHLEALARATEGRSFLGDAWGRFDCGAAVAALHGGAGSGPGTPVERRLRAVRVLPFAAAAFGLLLVEWLPFAARRRRAASALAAALAAAAVAGAPPVRSAAGDRARAEPGAEAPDPSGGGASASARALIDAGIAQLERGDSAAAAGTFLAAALRAREPGVAAVARYDLGVAAIAAGDLPSARDAFFAALAEDPNDRAARFNLEWTIGELRRIAASDDASQPEEPDGSVGSARTPPRPPRPETSRELAVPSLDPAQRQRWLDRVPDDPTPWLRSAAGGSALALVLAGHAAGAGDPPCAATAGPDRSHARVGQQLIYRVRIAHGDDVTAIEWARAPSFPGFRVEWLPEAADPEPFDAAPPLSHRREERRALFPERAGTLPLEPPALLCRLADGGTFAVPLPVTTVEAAAPPTREPGPAGVDLIGPVSLQTLVTPRDVALGDSVRVAIMLRGEGNLWIADDPLAPLANAEVFRRRPQLTRELGERLVFKRHFAYDVVPLRSGTLVVPAIRLAYFDPTADRYGAATSEPVRVTVRPRSGAPRGAATEEAPPEPSARAPNGSIPEPSAPAEAERHGAGRSALAVAALAAVALAALGLRRAKRRRALAVFDAALRRRSDGGDEAAALAHALRCALVRHVPDARARSAEEIVALPALPAAVADAAHLLAAIDRARFDPKAARPDAARVRAAAARL